MNSCLMFCCCILRLEIFNTIQWFEWILSLRGMHKLAQIELEIEGARISTRNGYVPVTVLLTYWSISAWFCLTMLIIFDGC